MAPSEELMLNHLNRLVSDLCVLEETRERRLAITKLEECIMWLERGREREEREEEMPKEFSPEHLKRMGVTMVKGGENE